MEDPNTNVNLKMQQMTSIDKSDAHFNFTQNTFGTQSVQQATQFVSKVKSLIGQPENTP